MAERRVCVSFGGVSGKEFNLLTKYAVMGCKIAFMERNAILGKKIKEELEKNYQVPVFFFHGDYDSEEDRDLFENAVNEMFGGADYMIFNSK